MQFNYLGGQSERDTLSQALGQRNPVLESQLSFNREAFTTGLQGANATLRTAMQIGAQESEAAMRNKTAKQEGAMNRASNTETLERRLSFDTNQANTLAETRKSEIAAGITQRKVEADAATNQRKIEADTALSARAAADKASGDAALDREKLRIGETEAAANRARTNLQKDKDNATIQDADSNLTAAELSFHTAMSATGDAYKFSDTGDYKVKTGKKIPDPTGATNSDGTPVMIDEIAKNEDGTDKTEHYSPKAREMMTNFDNLRKSIDSEKDPLKRAALIQKLIGSRQLDYNTSRGIVDSNYVAPASTTPDVELPRI